ncbi:MAG: FTR1 family protein [Chloroflexi bacterium]|nr:FTR1 family protein [Chloroflexota bacterium]
MFAALLITLREGLEIALVVGIVLGYLAKIGMRPQLRYAWAGVITASILSAGLAVGMRAFGAELHEPLEQIFEGTTMILAVIVLTWMVFWMRSQARYIKSELEEKIQGVVSGGHSWGIASLTFIAVFREGVETALFLAANAFAADAGQTLIGALIGLAIAIAVGAVIYTSARRINLKLFFDATSIFILLFAAGLLAHAVHEFQEIGGLPMLTKIAWDTNWLLTNDSVIGSLLRSLIGYNAQPSLLEVVSYLAYWVIIIETIRWWTQRVVSRAARA